MLIRQEAEKSPSSVMNFKHLSIWQEFELLQLEETFTVKDVHRSKSNFVPVKCNWLLTAGVRQQELLGVINKQPTMRPMCAGMLVEMEESVRNSSLAL